MSSWSKEQTTNFIEEYRRHECLWRIKSNDYSNKIKKERAYDNLLSYVNTFDPQANRDSVLKRIHNLRSSFRKELKKADLSKLSGSGCDDIYTPRLWYFDLMYFIKDQELPRLSTSNLAPPPKERHTVEATSNCLDMQVDRESVSDTLSPPPTEALSPYANENPSTEFDLLATQETEENAEELPPEDSQSIGKTGQLLNRSTSAASATICGNTLRSTKVDMPRVNASASKRKRMQEDQLLMMACKTLSSSSGADRFDMFGQTVAQSLKQMPGNQYLHAQKLISEITYAGELGLLSNKSYFVSVPTTQYQPTNPSAPTSTAYPTEMYRSFSY